MEFGVMNNIEKTIITNRKYAFVDVRISITLDNHFHYFLLIALFTASAINGLDISSKSSISSD